jgi:hypothetical protein
MMSVFQVFLVFNVPSCSPSVCHSSSL